MPPAHADPTVESSPSNPPSRTRSVRTGTRWYTIKKVPWKNPAFLGASIPLSDKSSKCCFPAKISPTLPHTSLSFEISSFLCHLCICHLSFTAQFDYSSVMLSLKTAPTLFPSVNTLTGLPNLLFTFYPRLSTFVHDKKSFQNSCTPKNVDSPRSRPRPVHTGSHSFTLVHNKKTFQKSPRSFFPRFRRRNLSFEISSFLCHLCVCHWSFAAGPAYRRAGLWLNSKTAPTRFLLPRAAR
jgi:hypothetical protein